MRSSPGVPPAEFHSRPGRHTHHGVPAPPVPRRQKKPRRSPPHRYLDVEALVKEARQRNPQPNGEPMKVVDLADMIGEPYGKVRRWSNGSQAPNGLARVKLEAAAGGGFSPNEMRNEKRGSAVQSLSMHNGDSMEADMLVQFRKLTLKEKIEIATLVLEKAKTKEPPHNQ